MEWPSAHAAGPRAAWVALRLRMLPEGHRGCSPCLCFLVRKPPCRSVLAEDGVCPACELSNSTNYKQQEPECHPGCVSPLPAGSSERPSASADRARPPPNPGQSGRAGAPAVRPALQGAAAGCGQSRCPGPPAPTARTLPQPPTPEQGGGLMRGPGSARRGSLLNSQTKAPATPTSQFKVPTFPAGE